MYSRVPISQAARTRYYKRNLSRRFEENRWLIFLGIAYLIGMVIGCEFISRTAIGYEDGIFAIFTNFIEVRSSQPIQDTVIFSFLSTFYLLVFLFLLGFCAISLPLIPMVPLFKGVGYGITIAAILQSEYRSQLTTILLLIVPYAAATACIVIVGAQYAIQLSRKCYHLFREEKADGQITVRAYCQSFVVLVVLTGLFSLMDAVLYSIIAKQILLPL